MDDSRYQKLADAAYRRVGDAFDDVDSSVVDCEIAGDVVTLTFKGGQRCILNTQRPTHQLWLAAVARAWHFAYDDVTERWMDDKGQGVELFAQIKTIVRELAGIDVTL